MSPEFKSIYNNSITEIINFIPEKSDIFSLGITYLRISLLLNDILLKGLNESKNYYLLYYYLSKIIYN